MPCTGAPLGHLTHMYCTAYMGCAQSTPPPFPPTHTHTHTFTIISSCTSSSCCCHHMQDTIVYDPFYHHMPAYFNLSFKELLAAKHPTAWIEFERGLISEADFLDKFFADGRAFDGPGLVQHMVSSRGGTTWGGGGGVPCSAVQCSDTAWGSTVQLPGGTLQRPLLCCMSCTLFSAVDLCQAAER